MFKLITVICTPLAVPLVLGLMSLWWVIQVLRENVPPIAIPFRMKGAVNSLDGIAEMFLRTAHEGMNLYCSHGFQRRQSRGGFCVNDLTLWIPSPCGGVGSIMVFDLPISFRNPGLRSRLNLVLVVSARADGDRANTCRRLKLMAQS